MKIGDRVRVKSSTKQTAFAGKVGTIIHIYDENALFPIEIEFGEKFAISCYQETELEGCDDCLSDS